MRFSFLYPIFDTLLFALIYGLVLFPAPTVALANRSLPVESVSQITIDDDGRGLHYPSTLFFDPGEQEIYLVNGGTSRVVVYGSDFFPQISIGSGRGVQSPRGVYVTGDGQVYVSQTRNVQNPVPRITILNGAFFPIRDILLDDLPEPNFAPSNLAVSRQGLIYLTGTTSRGVLVLDNEGNFLRRLEPMDMIADQEAIAAAAARRLSEEEKLFQEAGDNAKDQKNKGVDIPEEFRPKSAQQGGNRSGPGMGLVRVNNVTIDSEGNLYLISAETGKIYVYSADETFVFSFGSKGGTPGRLSQPRGLAVDEKRKLIYVADYMRHTILVYDFEGKFRAEVGGRGTAPGWFNFPADIAINRKGQIVVADLFNRRVQVLEVKYGTGFQVFQEVVVSSSSPQPAAAEQVDSVEETYPDEDLSGIPIEDAENDAVLPSVYDPLQLIPEEPMGFPEDEVLIPVKPIVEETL